METPHQREPDHGPAALPEPIRRAVIALGLACPGEHPTGAALAGGVSSDIWRVDLATGPVCVKRALARLRVAAEWKVPVERNANEAAWIEIANRAVPGSAPELLAVDRGEQAFAMGWLDPERYPTWKDRLRRGDADPRFAAAVGARIAEIHAATAGSTEIARRFATDGIFHGIRIEPYLLATATAHPAHASVLRALADRTAATRRTLVHGDVSPKNILCAEHGPMFIDAECAWYGDPAFDLAFCVNHLLLKCLWTPPATNAFLACFDALAGAYLERVDWEPAAEVEMRAATLLPGLLLARVDGKSPVEYLTAERDRERVRRVACGLLERSPAKLAAVADTWREARR